MISPVLLSVIFLIVTLCILLGWTHFIFATSDEDEEEILNTLKKQISSFKTKSSNLNFDVNKKKNTVIDLKTCSVEQAEDSDEYESSSLSSLNGLLEKKSLEMKSGKQDDQNSLSPSLSTEQTLSCSSSSMLGELVKLKQMSEVTNVSESNKIEDKFGSYTKDTYPKKFPRSHKSNKSRAHTPERDLSDDFSSQSYSTVEDKKSACNGNDVMTPKNESKVKKTSKTSDKNYDDSTDASGFRSCPSSEVVIVSKHRSRSPVKKRYISQKISNSSSSNEIIVKQQRKKINEIVSNNSSSTSINSSSRSEYLDLPKSRNQSKQNISNKVKPDAHHTKHLNKESKKPYELSTRKSSSDESFFKINKSSEDSSNVKIETSNQDNTEKRKEMEQGKHVYTSSSASSFWTCGTSPTRKKQKEIIKRKGSPNHHVVIKSRHSSPIKHEDTCVKDNNYLERQAKIDFDNHLSKCISPKECTYSAKNQGQENQAKKKISQLLVTENTNGIELNKGDTPEKTNEISRAQWNVGNKCITKKYDGAFMPNNISFAKTSIQVLERQSSQVTSLINENLSNGNSYKCIKNVLGSNELHQNKNAQENRMKELKKNYNKFIENASTNITAYPIKQHQEILKNNTFVNQIRRPTSPSKYYCNNRTLNNLLTNNLNGRNCESNVTTKKPQTKIIRSRSYEKIKSATENIFDKKMCHPNKACDTMVLANGHNEAIYDKNIILRTKLMNEVKRTNQSFTEIPTKADGSANIKRFGSKESIKPLKTECVTDRNKNQISFTNQFVNTESICQSECIQTTEVKVPLLNMTNNSNEDEISIKNTSINNDNNHSCITHDNTHDLPNLTMPNLNLIDVSNTLKKSRHLMKELAEETKTLLTSSHDKNQQNNKENLGSRIPILNANNVINNIVTSNNVTKPENDPSDIVLVNPIVATLSSALQQRRDSLMHEIAEEIQTFKDSKSRMIEQNSEIKHEESNLKVSNVVRKATDIKQDNQSQLNCGYGRVRGSSQSPVRNGISYQSCSSSRSPVRPDTEIPTSLNRQHTYRNRFRSLSPCNIPIRTNGLRSQSPCKLLNCTRMDTQRPQSPNISRSPVRKELRSSSPKSFVQSPRTDMSSTRPTSRSPTRHDMGCSTSNFNPNQITTQCTQTTEANAGRTRWTINPELKKYQSYEYGFPRDKWAATKAPVSVPTQNCYLGLDFYNPSPYLNRSTSPLPPPLNIRQENIRRFLQARDMATRTSR